MISGRCTVGLDEAYDIRTRSGRLDCSYQAASTPHWFGNPGTRKAELLFACTPCRRSEGPHRDRWRSDTRRAWSRQTFGGQAADTYRPLTE